LDFGKNPIQTFHLAEGPGGFIEAIITLRNNKGDTYTGMTLQDNTDVNVPAWKKSELFLKTNGNVIIENGITGTGNILSVENFVYCCQKYKSSMMFITGDGGFDFSDNFNEQEQKISHLLFAQIVYALCLQKRGGVFILKIFDFFMSYTVDLLYILSSFYEKVYLTKPDTSRHANSEKYLVCVGFLYDDCFYYPTLLNTFNKMVSNLSEEPVLHFIQKPVSYYFKVKLEEFNVCFGQQQIDNICSTLSLIKNETKHKKNKITELSKINLQKCVNWCIKYNVSICQP
jgi:hypothetical protein